MARCFCEDGTHVVASAGLGGPQPDDQAMQRVACDIQILDVERWTRS